MCAASSSCLTRALSAWNAWTLRANASVTGMGARPAHNHLKGAHMVAGAGIQAGLGQGDKGGSQALGLGAGQDKGIYGPCEWGGHPQCLLRNLLLHQLAAQPRGLHTVLYSSVFGRREREEDDIQTSKT